MKICVIASDSKIDETIEMHEYIFQKYWSMADITVLGYTEPNYKSDFIKFESLGVDLGADVLNKQLYDYFSKLDESQFIFGVMDMPVLKPVDIELINFYHKKRKKIKNIPTSYSVAKTSTIKLFSFKNIEIILEFIKIVFLVKFKS